MPNVIACTALKDCTYRLLRTIESWQKRNFIKNVIIVDWSSKNPIHLDPTIKKKISPKTYIIRIDGRLDFEFSWARNIGIRFATTHFLPTPEHILLIDADIFILHEFPCEWFVNNMYIKGRKNTRGTILFPSSYFYKTNGFNESKNWGCGGDNDFISALARKGLKNIYFYNTHKKLIHHINHSRRNNICYKSEKYPTISGKEWEKTGIMKKIQAKIYCPDGSIIEKEI